MAAFRRFRQWMRGAIRATGYDVVKRSPRKPGPQFPPDLDERDIALFSMVQPYTMTAVECVHALAEAVRYIVRHDIPGSFVECGVWKGGSMMVVARTLLDHGVGDRELFLFDTFDGMPAPSDSDINLRGDRAADMLAAADKRDTIWAISHLDETMRNARSVGYPPERIHFIEGRVEETLPGKAPEAIALLRLDMDWHEPTRHALEHLFPRLVRGGVLIVDDYGYWRGARKATDEYLQEHQVRILLHRINFTLRMGVKT
jgi:hypothetical protein